MPRWIKVIVAAALMVVLAITTDWSDLRAYAADVSWLIAAIAFLAIVLEMPVNATKWYWALRLHDQPFPWSYLFRIGCMSYFFNNFMPSAIGGDVYRVYRTWPTGGDKSFAVSAVVVERLLGVVILLANGFIGALFLLEHAIARTFATVALTATVAGLVCLPLFIRLQRNGALSRRFPRIASVEAMVGRILKLRSEWVWLLAASLVFQGLAAWVVYLCFAAVGSTIDVPTALLITAAAGLASVLPISISGLGVVEGSIAGTAVALGGDFEAAILGALLLRFVALAVSGACGLFCFVDDGVKIQPGSADVSAGLTIRPPAKPPAAATRST
jgi:glycosyltransferase 2 family protein